MNLPLALWGVFPHARDGYAQLLPSTIPRGRRIAPPMQPGYRNGSLTLVRHVPRPRGESHGHQVEVLCDCGRQFMLFACWFKRRSCPDCGPECGLRRKP